MTIKVVQLNKSLMILPERNYKVFKDKANKAN